MPTLRYAHKQHLAFGVSAGRQQMQAKLLQGPCPTEGEWRSRLERSCVMEKILYWLVRWPWIAATVAFLGLTQLPLGPWYVSAWFVIGAALLTMILARAGKLCSAEATVLRTRREQPNLPLGPQGAEVHL